MWKRRVILCMAFAAVAFTSVACGSESSSENDRSSAASQEKETTQVDVVNIAYDPETLRVTQGSEVTWTNLDENVHHTVTSGIPAKDGIPGVSEGKPAQADGTFDGDLAEDAAEFTFTFDKPGTYAYFCRVHPSMTAEVIVSG
jgi:plastocyanin